ncbi:hypothetical protein O59_003293 [Cellvibrio sp. BR]|nr:hypothetical protein O59_003293 [Cellvibrio sp. BR]
MFFATAVYAVPEHLMRPAVTVEWTELLPDEDLRLLESIPQVDHESMSEDELALDSPMEGLNSNTSAFEDQVANAIAESKQAIADEKKYGRDWRDALKSTKVRPEFNNKRIRIAGYIVPIEYDDNQVITEFFLVPYFGACIHVPPPPPNQLIYVKHPKGFQLPDLYTPFWVDGTVVIETQENELGLSAYSMRNVKLTRYEEPEEPEFLN